MMFDTVSFPPTSRQILVFFKNICVICGHPACVVHEIEPRSRGNNPLRFENRIALCGDCHDWCHNQGVSPKEVETLKFLRENRIKMIYGDNPPAIEDIT
jgi:hypothetical protein